MLPLRQNISEHIFIYPFSWKSAQIGKKMLFEPHTQLKGRGFEKLSHWSAELTTIENEQDYNEFVYFHKPIRSALYTFGKEAPIVRNYCYKSLDENRFFSLDVDGKTYDLGLRKVKLKLYKTGIGLLSFEIDNWQYRSLEEIEAINSFSKIIYPPILPLEKARGEKFPERVRMRLNEATYIEESFSGDYFSTEISISNLILSVLGEPFTSKQVRFSKHRILIEKIGRAHV